MTDTEYEWGVVLEPDEPPTWERAALVVRPDGERALGTEPHTEETARQEFRSRWHDEPKLVRRLVGEQDQGAYEVVPYGPPPRCEPPTLHGSEHLGITLEQWGEDGEISIARGHHDPETFLAAFCADYLATNKPFTLAGELYTPQPPEAEASEVRHRLAVFEEGWGYDDDGVVVIVYVEDDPTAIPVTVLDLS